MAKKRKQQKKRGCGFPLLLALLCLFVAAAYYQPEVKLPESVEQKAEALLQQGKDTLTTAKDGLSKWLQELLVLLPED